MLLLIPYSMLFQVAECCIAGTVPASVSACPLPIQPYGCLCWLPCFFCNVLVSLSFQSTWLEELWLGGLYLRTGWGIIEDEVGGRHSENPLWLYCQVGWDSWLQLQGVGGCCSSSRDDNSKGNGLWGELHRGTMHENNIIDAGLPSYYIACYITAI